MKGVIKKIFFDNLEAYIASGESKELKKRPYLIKWLKKMVYCGSLWLGVDEYRCDCGKHVKYIAVHCKTKICLCCGWVYRLRQIIKVLFYSLRCSYFFITFTVPHNLHFIFEDNRKEYLKAFNQAITATFKAYMKKRKLNVLPGIISIPHTFGSMLQLHVHFHVLISCGGINRHTGEWIKINHYPINFLKKTFRAKFVAKLRSLHKHNRLKFTDNNMYDYKKYNKILKKAFGFNKAWYTHISCKDKKNKKDIKDGDILHSIVYALRYLNRLPISEYNIVGYDGKYVIWLPKKNKFEDEQFWKIYRKMKTPVFEFMEKLLMHIPSKNERTIYYSGLYAPNQKDNLYKTAKKHFNNKCMFESLKKKEKAYLFKWADLRKWFDPENKYPNRVDPSICPFCGDKIKFIQRHTYTEAMCKAYKILNNQIVPINNSS